MTMETTVLAADVAWRERVDDRLEHVDDRLEHVEGRLERVEGRLGRVERGLERLEARFEATLPHLATKADVQAAVNALTWKLIAAGVALSGVIIAAIAAAAAWIKLF